MITHLLQFTSCLEAVFFDFDGVLVDSVPIKTLAFQQIFEPYGSKAVQTITDYHLAHGGIDRYIKIRFALDAIGAPCHDSIVNNLADEFSRLVKEKICQEPLLEGMASLLDGLRQRGVKMFIVSGTPQGELKEILNAKGLTTYFFEVCGSPRSKIEILSELAQRYNIDPRNAFFLGDAAGDFLAAKECGMWFLGFFAQS